MIYAKLGDELASYMGLSLDTVVTMLTEQKVAFTIIDEQTYNAELELIKGKQNGLTSN